MKKKGFTLVELLAVIAILAILIIMAVPAVIKLFNKSRIDTFNNELNTIIKAAQHQYILDGEATTYSNSSNPLRVTSNSDFSYCITVNAEGDIINFKATNGSYKYESNGIVEETSSSDIEDAESGYSLSCTGSSVVHVATCVEEGCTKTTVETELIIGEEYFYVVSSDSTNTVLLAKYDLKQDGSSYTQDTSGTNTGIIKSQFYRLSYWCGVGLGSQYANSANEEGKTGSYSAPYPYVYDSNTYIYEKINDYVDKLTNVTGITITGRVMTYDEGNSLSTNVRTDHNGFYYWLGSAQGCAKMWTISNSGTFYGDNYYSDIRAIRPVIIVPTAAL